MFGDCLFSTASYPVFFICLTASCIDRYKIFFTVLPPPRIFSAVLTFFISLHNYVFQLTFLIFSFSLLSVDLALRAYSSTLEDFLSRIEYSHGQLDFLQFIILFQWHQLPHLRLRILLQLQLQILFQRESKLMQCSIRRQVKI